MVNYFINFSRSHLVLRILQMCYDIRNGSYSCFCAANLITSLHALTTFHCVDNRAYGDKCAERDFSDGEKKIFVCLTVLWVSELPFFTTIEKTKRLLTLLTIGLSSRNLWYSQLKDEDEGIGWGWVLSFGKTSLNQNLKRQEEKKRIIHRKIQCASIPFGAKKTPCSWFMAA